MTDSLSEITLGFMPLTDAAPLIVAKELGIFAKFGLSVSLKMQSSWTALRENLHSGAIHCAQMLAPMPIESQLALNGKAYPVIAPLILSEHGNAITLSSELYQLMGKKLGYQALLPLNASQLAPVVKSYKRKGRKLTFAVVYRYSCHYYQLLRWLALGQINCKDVEIVEISPCNIVAALAAGDIDGFCSGEPWNTIAARRGCGYTVVTSSEIWSNVPEKVLGLLEGFYQKYPDQVLALVSALVEAARWLENNANRFEAAVMLAQTGYLNMPIEYIAPSLIGSSLINQQQSPRIVTHYHQFHSLNGDQSQCPDKRYVESLLSQMLYAKHLTPMQIKRCAIHNIYRADIYQMAVST